MTFDTAPDLVTEAGLRTQLPSSKPAMKETEKKKKNCKIMLISPLDYFALEHVVFFFLSIYYLCQPVVGLLFLVN